MKKYLMTGIAALAMCFGFTSCSHDIEPASQEDLNNLEAEQIVNAYNQAFIKTFGQPAADQDWGFGTSATRGITRSVDVNGNEWKSCPSLETGEAQAVYDWVNKPKNQIPKESYDEVSPVDLKNFFVTQVWGKNENEDDENCQYTDYDGGAVFGSTKMNHLQISKSEERLGTDGVPSVNATWDKPGGDAINADWDHANNFNAASNQDWNGNTMFVNWGTKNFAYHNSNDSRYHDKWIIVDGYYITTDHRFAGKYYVCFDFISRDPNVYTNFQDASGQNYEVPGAWKNVTDAVAGGAKARIWDHYDAENNMNVYSEGPAVGSNWKWVNITGPSGGGNRIVDANDIYTDWIIRLVEAEPVNKPADYDVRIIAEDLNATAQDGDLENSDWDFNDVVFDVKFTSDNDAEITLIAAGGTLPLVVGIVPEDGMDSYPNNEVHALFGVPVNYMVNTNAEKKNLTGGAPAAGHEAPKINFTKTGVKASNGKDIPIYVQKTLKNGTKKWFQLRAEKGQPASKLAVNSKSTNFSICDEREDITKKYTNFKSWVVNNDPLIWWE